MPTEATSPELCAWHLRQAIERHRPTAILVEGPADTNPLIPLIADPESIAPRCLYYADAEGGNDEAEGRSDSP